MLELFLLLLELVLFVVQLLTTWMVHVQNIRIHFDIFHNARFCYSFLCNRSGFLTVGFGGLDDAHFHSTHLVGFSGMWLLHKRFPDVELALECSAFVLLALPCFAFGAHVSEFFAFESLAL